MAKNLDLTHWPLEPQFEPSDSPRTRLVKRWSNRLVKGSPMPFWWYIFAPLDARVMLCLAGDANAKQMVQAFHQAYVCGIRRDSYPSNGCCREGEDSVQLSRRRGRRIR